MLNNSLRELNSIVPALQQNLAVSYSTVRPLKAHLSLSHHSDFEGKKGILDTEKKLKECRWRFGV